MKYWIYSDGEVPGSYEPEALARLPGFDLSSLVCPAEGGDAERRWSRAGTHPDIASALNRVSLPPAPPPPSPAALASGADAALEETGQRLFRHITGLMRELEGRREERAVLQSLHKSLAAQEAQLASARERIRSLEASNACIPDLEERERKLQRAVAAARQELQEREAKLQELRKDYQGAQEQRDEALRARAQAREQAQGLEKLVEDLNHELAQKEAALARCMGLLQRLEEQIAALSQRPGAGEPRASSGPERSRQDALQPRPPAPVCRQGPGERSTTCPRPLAPQPVVREEEVVLPRVQEGTAARAQALPPEGVLAMPIRPPWQLALQHTFSLMRRRFAP